MRSAAISGRPRCSAVGWLPAFCVSQSAGIFMAGPFGGDGPRRRTLAGTRNLGPGRGADNRPRAPPERAGGKAYIGRSATRARVVPCWPADRYTPIQASRMHRTDRAGPPSSEAEVVFPADSEMGRLCREMDWAATPLGPVDEWPRSLKTA